MNVCSLRVGPPSLSLLALLAAGTAFPHGAAAQAETTVIMRGVVRTADSVPLAESLLRLARDTGEVAVVRTLPNGSYTMPRLDPGAYTLTVKRIGYETRQLPVQISESRVFLFDVTLAVLPVTVEAARVAAGWTGVIGVVGDYANMEPIGGVTLRPLDDLDSVTSDANGRFVLALPEGGTGALRVERAGYAPRLVSYRVPPGKRAEVTVLLDSGSTARNDEWTWKDLAQRHRWSTPRSVRVARSELLATGAHNLLVALEQSPTVQASGLTFTRAACLYVNGQPRPGFPIDALVTERVEYVEGYAVRGDLSRSLQTRWPANSSCGTAGGDVAIRRAIENGQGVQYVVVWLR